jgi:hypothetical protein
MTTVPTMADHREGDRVRHKSRRGTVEQVSSGPHPYRVHFEDGTFGAFASAELEQLDESDDVDEAEPEAPRIPEYGELREPE